MMKIMDAATLKQLLLQDKAVVIDVREQDEYDAVHLAGAHLIPLGEVSNHPLPPVAGRKLVLHCRAGV
jgi:rhodanese-related sulfurtransferase